MSQPAYRLGRDSTGWTIEQRREKKDGTIWYSAVSYYGDRIEQAALALLERLAHHGTDDQRDVAAIIKEIRKARRQVLDQIDSTFQAYVEAHANEDTTLARQWRTTIKRRQEEPDETR